MLVQCFQANIDLYRIKVISDKSIHHGKLSVGIQWVVSLHCTALRPDNAAGKSTHSHKKLRYHFLAAEQRTVWCVCLDVFPETDEIMNEILSVHSPDKLLNYVSDFHPRNQLYPDVGLSANHRFFFTQCCSKL